MFKESELLRYAVYYVIPRVGLQQQVIINQINTSPVGRVNIKRGGGQPHSLTNNIGQYRSALAKMIGGQGRFEHQMSNERPFGFQNFSDLQRRNSGFVFRFRNPNLLFSTLP